MAPPQCPECGRFLATAFIKQIEQAATPCPRCGTELSLVDDADGPPTAADAAPTADPTPEPEPAPTPEPEPTPAPETVEVPLLVDGAAPAASADESVRPPDLGATSDPLAGWDSTPEPVADMAIDPAALAAGAGAGALLGILLGGRGHRTLGAMLGAALGAVLTRLRG